MKIIIALLIFSIIIIIHEFGHFLLAKKNGIGVTEFSIGMGPKLVHVKRGETEYCIKALPFGGSCMMLGEDGLNSEEAVSSEKAFGNKSVWARISVIAAGPIFNFILAFVLAVIIVGSIGFDAPVVGDVMEGYPAEAAGIQSGDEILRLNGERIYVYREITMFSQFHQGETVEIEYKRDGKVYRAAVEPKADESGRYLMGLSKLKTREKGNTWDVLKYSAYEVRYWINTTIKSIGMIFKGQVTMDDMSGPVGIVGAIGDTYEQSKEDGAFYVWINMLNISILLSANLGVMNLLPIPALDGGRLVFLILELIRGKKINPEKEGMVHFIGLVLLMLLMVVIMFNDIRKLF